MSLENYVASYEYYSTFPLQANPGYVQDESFTECRAKRIKQFCQNNVTHATWSNAQLLERSNMVAACTEGKASFPRTKLVLRLWI